MTDGLDLGWKVPCNGAIILNMQITVFVSKVCMMITEIEDKQCVCMYFLYLHLTLCMTTYIMRYREIIMTVQFTHVYKRWVVLYGPQQVLRLCSVMAKM